VIACQNALSYCYISLLCMNIFLGTHLIWQVILQ